MNSAFLIAGGSIAGRQHALAGRNNQDAFAWRVGDAGLAAVVCDGCSGGPHNELGARLAANLLAESLLLGLDSRTAESFALPSLLDGARLELLAHLSELAASMGPPSARTEVVRDHFLFAVVGALVCAQGWAVFALGDGVIRLNGRPRVLGPFPGNEPPYLGYGLLRGDFERWQFELVDSGPLATLETLAFGTDGAIELLSGEAGSVADEWMADGRVFDNRDLVRRRLWLQARERRLDDDATVVLVRRARGEG